MKKTNKVLVAGALGFALLAGTLGNTGSVGAAAKSEPGKVVALPDSGIVFKGAPLKVKPPVLPKKPKPIAKAAVSKKVEVTKITPVKKPAKPTPIVKSPFKPVIKKPVQPAPVKVEAKKPVVTKPVVVAKPVVKPVVTKPVIVAPPIVKIEDTTRFVAPEVTKEEFIKLGFATKEFTADQNGIKFSDFANFEAYKVQRLAMFNSDIPMAKEYWALQDQDIMPILNEELKNDVYKAATFFNVFE